MSTETTAKNMARREAFLDATEVLIERGGVHAVTAREVARHCGCAVGLLYNHFEDIDDLILRANSRFIAKLDAAMADAFEAAGDTLSEKYVAMALAYLRFALQNRNAWAALFEHRMSGGRPIPDWHLEEHMRMFRHVEIPLRDVVPDMPPAERLAFARTIYSSVHGVVALSIQTRLTSVTVPQLEQQLRTFVLALAAGVRATLAD